jgi:hypothetical protein
VRDRRAVDVVVLRRRVDSHRLAPVTLQRDVLTGPERVLLGRYVDPIEDRALLDDHL